MRKVFSSVFTIALLATFLFLLLVAISRGQESHIAISNFIAITN